MVLPPRALRELVQGKLGRTGQKGGRKCGSQEVTSELVS